MKIIVHANSAAIHMAGGLLMRAPLSAVLLAKMNGRRLAYFEAAMVDGSLEIGDEERAQPW